MPKHSLVINTHSSAHELAQAAALLDRCEAVVVLEGVATLRPTPELILCDITDPAPATHRCAEEFKVMIENASRILAASKLAQQLPCRPLQWRVVEITDAGSTVLWREP